MPQLIDITDTDGFVITADWLARAEALHRQLRPHLPVDYAAKMQTVFAGGGRMRVATDGDRVQGVAVWRLVENTAEGRIVYIDDLVTDELRRSTGVGRTLFRSIEATALGLGCGKLTLDAGTQRQRAHTFYFREGMTITSFHFGKTLTF
jgi:GNAT superfamily N-acetyltransferase